MLIAWENEAFLALNEFGADKFEIVVPTLSIKAEPPVTLVDENAKAKGNTKVAEAYLQFLYSPEGQKLAAKHLFPADRIHSRATRPISPVPQARSGHHRR